MIRLAIVSDIHYAGPLEQRHGPNFAFAGGRTALARTMGRLWEHHVWMCDPLAHNALLDCFLEEAAGADRVIANGDYTCDAAGLGVSGDDAKESALLCLGKLRDRFGGRFHATLGDHELGKVSLLGDHGGLRLESLRRAVGECGLLPFWRVEVGRFVMMGITSTLVGLPAFRQDALDSEWAEWETLRAVHLDEIRSAFSALDPSQRVLLFCHDPTALPFLWREEAVRARAGQIAGTIIGHLHTRLVLWKSQLLAGFPPMRCLGVAMQRMTTALHDARAWRPFKVHLCPALAGIELVGRGGFLTVELNEDGTERPPITLHPIRRQKPTH
jgi:hypothetical protein